MFCLIGCVKSLEVCEIVMEVCGSYYPHVVLPHVQFFCTNYSLRKVRLVHSKEEAILHN